jgi:hypothetical protein
MSRMQTSMGFSSSGEVESYSRRLGASYTRHMGDVRALAHLLGSDVTGLNVYPSELHKYKEEITQMVPEEVLEPKHNLGGILSSQTPEQAREASQYNQQLYAGVIPGMTGVTNMQGRINILLDLLRNN